MSTSSFREERIIRLYQKLNIKTVSDLSISNLSNILSFKVIYYNLRSRCIYDDECALIYLNKYQSIEGIRYDFFHEMAHFFEHSNDQRFTNRDFVQFQERQAHSFALYASMPRYILDDYLPHITSITELVEIFQLPQSFIYERLNTIQQQNVLGAANSFKANTTIK
ncbi:ImmA/IrrE family metallo-endopeptidase [Bacillus sp. JCM 19034]|uniref:ImmA/IrrE family metallo-endopeptidase n=1 Tax=Bacillus sp. JCM 19034 TaxID=1481928 RepID=UPI0007839528|nr:ImmA/IrrE family metallo-endopeptidase [Bacillus sp. JCM 19034]